MPTIVQQAPIQEAVQVILPEPPRGDARDKVGEQLGVSGHKAERAAAVVRIIDALDVARYQASAYTRAHRTAHIGARTPQTAKDQELYGRAAIIHIREMHFEGLIQGG